MEPTSTVFIGVLSKKLAVQSAAHLYRFPADRINRQQRHQSRQRMRPRFDKLRHIFANHVRAADIHQSLGGFALLRLEFVFRRDGIEIFDDAPAQRLILAKIKKQAIQLISGSRRMLVKLETGILETESAVFG